MNNVEEILINTIQKHTNNKVTLSSGFSCELGIDSMNLAFIIDGLEKIFNICISGEDERKIESVEDCLNIIRKKIEEK